MLLYGILVLGGNNKNSSYIMYIIQIISIILNKWC
uniref:Uncharacterized protein n=1 Tax=Anguilla anguilla TaxID=7936 RepID=A0A0E9VZG4_ANGAN